MPQNPRDPMVRQTGRAVVGAVYDAWQAIGLNDYPSMVIHLSSYIASLSRTAIGIDPPEIDYLDGITATEEAIADNRGELTDAELIKVLAGEMATLAHGWLRLDRGRA